MAISVTNSIQISATLQLVWEVFTDIRKWSVWNPLVLEVNQISAGSLWVPGGRFTQKYKRDFTPEQIATKSIVQEVLPGRKITWSGEVLGSHGVISYEFIPFGANTLVTATEVFAETDSDQVNFIIQRTSKRYLALSLIGLKQHIEDTIGHHKRSI